MLTELEQRADTEARHAHRKLVEKLEAKLEKATEALNAVCYLIEEQCSDRLYDQTIAGWGHCANHLDDVARATLAELKGETND